VEEERLDQRKEDREVKIKEDRSFKMTESKMYPMVCDLDRQLHVWSSKLIKNVNQLPDGEQPCECGKIKWKDRLTVRNEKESDNVEV